MPKQSSSTAAPPGDTRPEPSDAMSHLATLTAQRDRELLDVSLAQGVLDLLGACSAGVYRLVGREEIGRAHV